MIKRLFIVLGILLFVSSCYEPQRDCSSYRTGEFLFNYEIGDSIKTGRFTRDETYSIDYYDGKIDSARIRWINDCEFVLQDIHSKMGVQYKIISTTDSSYTFQYSNAVRNPNRKLIVKTGTAFKTN